MEYPRYVLQIHGWSGVRTWHGPFGAESSPTAEEVAFGLQTSTRQEIYHYPYTAKGIVEEAEFLGRVFFGEGKVKPPGERMYWFSGEWEEIIPVENEGSYILMKSSDVAAIAESEVEDDLYCAGPMVEDFCEPCEGVTDVANTFYVAEMDNGSFFPLGGEGVEFIPDGNGVDDPLYKSVCKPTQEEVDGVCEYFSVPESSFFSAGGNNDVYSSYGYQVVAGIVVPSGGFPSMYGYHNTNQGAKWYVPDDKVQEWVTSGGLVFFQAFDPPEYPYWNPFAEEFDEPQIYFLGWQYKCELFAQVVRSNNDFGGQYTARSVYDLGFYNEIEDFPGYQTYYFYNTIDTGFVPAGETFFVGKEWYRQPAVYAELPIGFRHTNNLNGKIEGKMVGPWALSVNMQITPLFVAANGYSKCDVELAGPTSALTVIARCPRNSWDLPFPYAITMPGEVVINPDDHRNYESWPFDAGIFRETGGIPDAPEPKTTLKFVGWSGNGIDKWILFILNPAWAVNLFIGNYPPFKRLPQYRKMIEFIRHLTGKKNQYDALGIDPVTGWEYYPVPVIVGADGGGFPVYGDPVYIEVPSGTENQ